MNCQHLLLIHRRIRVARLSALDGQCNVANRLIARAGRDLARVKADGAITANACARALVKGTSEFLAEGRRQLRERCGPARGKR